MTSKSSRCLYSRPECPLERKSQHPCFFRALSHFAISFRIVVLSGDGIGSWTSLLLHTQADATLGPEVVGQAVRVLEVVSELHSDFDLKLESHLFGGCAIEATGEPLPPSTLKACQEADAILMGT